MEPVETLVLDGLLEGLVLHAVETDPTHGYGILKDIETALGEAPNKNKVYRLLRKLEDEGMLVSEEVEEESRTRQVYSLTEDGRARLDAYRNLPGQFKALLSGTLGIGEHEPEPSPDRTEVTDAWIRDALDRLPGNPSIQAPRARISFDRSPSQRTWSLTVEDHEPGQYDGSDACPLTFLYLATQQLMFGPGP